MVMAFDGNPIEPNPKSGSMDPVQETISVVVTAWRRREFLGDALASVQSPAGWPLELVVVADFSGGDVEQEVRRRNGKWILSREGRLGAMTAEGVRRATGSLLAFLDDDDLFHPLRLDQVRSVFQKDPDLGFFHNSHVVFGNGDLPDFQPTGRPFHEIRIPPNRRTQSDCEFVWTEGAGYNGSSIVIRRSLLEDHLEELAEIRKAVPPYLFYRAWSAPKALVLDSRPLTAVRMHASNMTPNRLQTRRARLQRLASIATDLSADSKEILAFLPGDVWCVPLRQMSSIGEIFAFANGARTSSRRLLQTALELLRRRRIWLPRWSLVALAVLSAGSPRGARAVFNRFIVRGGGSAIESP